MKRGVVVGYQRILGQCFDGKHRQPVVASVAQSRSGSSDSRAASPAADRSNDSASVAMARSAHRCHPVGALFRIALLQLELDAG